MKGSCESECVPASRRSQPKYRFFLYKRIEKTWQRRDILPFLPLYVVCVALVVWYQLNPPPEDLASSQSVWLKPDSVTCTHSAITNACPRSKHYFFPKKDLALRNETATHIWRESSSVYAHDNLSVCFGSRGSDDNVESSSGTEYVSVVEKARLENALLNPTAYAWLLRTLVLALVHLVVWLSGEWSVRIKCWTSYFQLDIARIDTDGTDVLVVSHKKSIWNFDPEKQVRRQLCPLVREPGAIYLFHEKKKLLYDGDSAFETLKFPTARALDFYTSSDGLSTTTEKNDHHSDGCGRGGGVQEARKYYGPNEYDIPMATFKDLFKEHATSPFFVFQVFCVGLWLLDEYWQYGVLTLGMLILLECQLVKKRLKELGELRSMRMKPRMLSVYRDHTWKLQMSNELVPGDICSITRATEMCPADCLLLQGTAVVNESMLTGESVTQMKVELDVRQPSELLDIRAKHKQSVIFAGTSVVMHKNDKTEYKTRTGRIKNGNKACLCYVLRTGFHTTQGRLVRTILFSSERVTVSSKEALYFLLILLAFAVAASVYVLRHGLTESRSLFSLLLSCSHIITSVVPPEFPITLSLAVTLSLLTLVSKSVYCTEPFRVPFAGNVDICAFDKTGTLTSDSMQVVQVAGDEAHSALAAMAMGACHNLCLVDEDVVGDPLDKTAFEWSGWKMGPGDTLVKGGAASSGELGGRELGGGGGGKGTEERLVILTRFVFSSELQRITAVVTKAEKGRRRKEQQEEAAGGALWVVMKGAPEKVREFLVDVDAEEYQKTFERFSIQGYRVLCLAGKRLERSSDWRQLDRPELEKELTFAGFLVLRCPIKPHTAAHIQNLKESMHELIMVTGDNPLTACEVCKDVGMVAGDREDSEFWVLDLALDNKAAVAWRNREGSQTLEMHRYKKELLSRNSRSRLSTVLCVTGPALSTLEDDVAADIISHTTIFARVSPQQKQLVISTFNRRKKVTLMCGDGTNDVGGLKAAHVGVSLLNELPQTAKPHKHNITTITTTTTHPSPTSTSTTTAEPPSPLDSAMDGPPIVRLGEASIASPFTYKGDSIRCVPVIMRTGRATLATVIMMYKLMALNSLVTAFALSVLTLDGVKLGDFQTTVENLFATVLHLMLARAKPLKQLSMVKPVSSVFDPSVLASLVTQTCVHFTALVVGWQMAVAYRPWSYEVQLDTEFRPSLVNTVVFYLISSMHASSFLSNYEGYPFMTPLYDNRPLLCMLIVFLTTILLGVLELFPGFNRMFSLVPAPDAAFRNRLALLVVADVALSWLCAVLASKLRLLYEYRKAGKNKKQPLATAGRPTD